MLTINSFYEIKAWFDKNGQVEFDLPDKHFGRPGDCFESLDWISFEREFLVIRLNPTGTSREFVFHGKMNYQFVDNCLEISNFESLVFVWQEAVKSIFHTETYDLGTVRFIPHRID